MVHFSDTEISILLNAFTKIRVALRQDKSSTTQNIMKGITESEKIVKSKKTAANAAPLGGSVSTSKTKELFEMFHLTNRIH